MMYGSGVVYIHGAAPQMPAPAANRVAPVQVVHPQVLYSAPLQATMVTVAMAPSLTAVSPAGAQPVAPQLPQVQAVTAVPVQSHGPPQAVTAVPVQSATRADSPGTPAAAAVVLANDPPVQSSAKAPKAPASSAAAQQQWPSAEEQEASGIYVGVVKKFIVDRPEGIFGFIRCGTTYRKYGCDVFIPPEECRGLVIGDRVKFVVMLSKHGKPQARHVALQLPQ
eukprot:TRINITY_DN1077_c0_g1_i2.p1 TRINITY_DN1077_c0_g1~~TRINITY_DN1077_c0_g1_i2.p1  ORF type:complete len:223 (+),score=22.01 TRINITY_DN1077_c0_g1_i2:125-793(+)